MLVNENVRMALSSLRTSRWRSFLTMLGIIIGVASVATIVSLGEGVRRQVSSQIDAQGKDLITIQPGANVGKSGSGSYFGLMNNRPSGSLSEADLLTIQATRGVKYAVPFGIVNGIPEADGQQLSGVSIIATNETLPSALNQEVDHGSFFSKGDGRRHIAVIGKNVAEALFKENVPTGRMFNIRDQEFIVGGVFAQFEGEPLSAGVDYNSAIFIPYQTATQVNGANAPIFQILARADNAANVDRIVGSINQNLKATHGNQQDFTVLKAQDSLTTATTALSLITQLIGGIAAISLLVGGIGIMNIMLVSVTERTQEIGVRKALGATNHQILSQFVIEAAVLSFVGGMSGVVVSLLANVMLRIMTDFQPVITWPIMAIATGVALVVGVVFGLMPAIGAARKNPIDALKSV